MQISFYNYVPTTSGCTSPTYEVRYSDDSVSLPSFVTSFTESTKVIVIYSIDESDAGDHVFNITLYLTIDVDTTVEASSPIFITSIVEQEFTAGEENIYALPYYTSLTAPDDDISVVADFGDAASFCELVND